MSTLLALVLMALCGLSIIMAIVRPGPIRIFLATLSLFVLGYYVLPVLLIDRSALRYLPSRDVETVILMTLAFVLSMAAGLAAVATQSRRLPRMEFDMVDRFLGSNWWAGAILANAVIFAYISTRPLTFYQAGSVEEFVGSQSLLSAILGLANGICQALAAIFLVSAYKSRNVMRLMFSSACLIVQLIIFATTATRLAFLVPMMTVFGALVADRQYRTAGSILATAVGGLLLISPFAVALRSGSWDNSQDVQAANFTYGTDPVSTIIQSIVDRADILSNMVVLKSHVDRNGHVSAKYYISVLVIPVPRAIFSNKPAVLSDTGSAEGEASILVWNLVSGGSGVKGSLTAFGPIIAYREGGWPWVIVNGFLTGCVYAFFLLAAYRGGIVGRSFFILAFIAWAVKKSPASLMEGMVDVMSYLPVLFFIYAVNLLLRYGRIGTGSDAGLAGSTASSTSAAAS